MLKYILQIIFVPCVLTIASAQKFEEEGLPSIIEHEQRDWFLAAFRSTSNILFVEQLLSADTSLHKTPSSIQHKRVLQWVRKTKHATDALGHQLYLPNTSKEIGIIQNIQSQKQSDNLQELAPWKEIGPVSWDKQARMATGSMGIGVIRCLDIHPKQSSTLLVGTISAGVWRSTNSGTTWQNVTKADPVTTTFQVVIAPSNPNYVYAATNCGLLLSKNNGVTFSSTSIANITSYPNAQPVFDVTVNPTNEQHCVVVYNSGCYYSTNGGITFSRCSIDGDTTLANINQEICDVLWHPTDRNVVYALLQIGTTLRYYRSNDGGKNFLPSTPITGLTAIESATIVYRGRLAVSAAEPNRVFVLAAGRNESIDGIIGLYVSANSGVTFNPICCGEHDGLEDASATNNPNLIHYDIDKNGAGQAGWVMALAAHPTNKNTLAVAGIFPYQTFDGAKTWKSQAPLHYDVQNIHYIGDTLWIAHDGGLSMATDSGNVVIDKSDGIQALEVWGFGQSYDGSIMAVGAYHMPTIIRNDSVYASNGFEGGWYAYSGADAMNADVNPTDKSWIYAKPWGNIRAKLVQEKRKVPISTELGIDLGYISMSNMSFHPNNMYEFVAADHETKSFVRTTTNADTWETLQTFTTSVGRVSRCIQEPNVLCGIADDAVWYSTGDNKKWVNITPPVELSASNRVVDVCLHPEQPNIVYVAYGAHQSSAKVLMSVNAGRTWTNISANLPMFEIGALAIQQTTGIVYVGTTAGVYYKTPSSQDWIPLRSGLPFTNINFMQIDEPHSTLRVATNRGLWQTSLPVESAISAIISQSSHSVECSQFPVMFTDRSTGLRDISYNRSWNFDGGTPATSTQPEVLVYYNSPGVFNVTLTIERNGIVDVATTTIIVENSGCASPDTVSGKAVDLRAGNDAVVLEKLNYSGNSLCVSMWVKPTEYQAVYTALVSAIDPEEKGREFGIHFVNDSNELGYLWGGGRWWWSSGLRLPVNEWSFVEMCVQPTGVTIRLNEHTAFEQRTMQPQDFSDLSLLLGTFKQWENRNFNGLIDNLQIYSGNEQRTLQHIISQDSLALLKQFEFNDQYGSIVVDKLHGQYATLQSATLVESGAPVSKGIATRVATAEAQPLAKQLGIELECGIPGRVLVSRLQQTPTRPPQLPFLHGVYWVVSADSSQSQGSVKTIRLYLDDLIPRTQAALRKYSLLSRAYTSDSAYWSNSIAIGTAQYNVQNNSVTFECITGTKPGHQLVLGLDSMLTSTNHDETEINAQISIVPNPATEFISVTISSNQTGMITIYNSFGQIVAQHALPRERTQLNISHLVNGVYTLEYANQRVLFVVNK